MSDQLDDRIRDLYAELVDAAPPVPPLPDLVTVSSPWLRRWPVLAAAAVATIAVLSAVPILVGGEFFEAGDEAADTTLVAAETSIAPETTAASEPTEVATETTTIEPETTGSPFIDALQSPNVTTQLVELSPEVLAAVDGLVLDAHVFFTWPDGSEGSSDVVIIVENGAATMLLGRHCGTDFGPRSLTSQTGGVVVNSTSPDIRLCTPGEPVETLEVSGGAVDTALVEGQPVLALTTGDRVDLLNLNDGSMANLVTFEADLEHAESVTHGGGRWVVSVGEFGEPTFFGETHTRYAFFDESGAELDIPGNPAPDYSPSTTTYREAALTSDGEQLVLVEQFADLAADVVVWDLSAGAEVERYPILDPFAGPTDDAGGGQMALGSVDATDTEIVVTVVTANGHVYPSQIVRIDRSTGAINELSSGVDEIVFQRASFLDS